MLKRHVRRSGKLQTINRTFGLKDQETVNFLPFAFISNLEWSRIQKLRVVFLCSLVLCMLTLNLGLGWRWQAFCQQVPGIDKFFHFTLYAGAFLLMSGTKMSDQWIKPVGLLLLVLIFGTLEEMSHAWMATRAFEILDLLANYAGAFLGFFGLISRNGFAKQRALSV